MSAQPTVAPPPGRLLAWLVLIGVGPAACGGGAAHTMPASPTAGAEAQPAATEAAEGTGAQAVAAEGTGAQAEPEPPEALEVRRNLAYALLTESEYAAAWGHIQALQAAGDDSWWLHLAAAQVCLYWSLDYDCTEREATRALELQPDSARAHLLLAQLYEDRGQTQDAISHYRQSLALRPSESEVAVRLANLLAQDGQTEAAASLLRDTLDRRPQDARVMVQLARILEATDPAAAEDLYQRAAAYHDTSMLAYGYLIRFYEHQGRRRDADAIRRLVGQGTARAPMRPIW